jgi:hypothetical protein
MSDNNTKKNRIQTVDERVWGEELKYPVEL